MMPQLELDHYDFYLIVVGHANLAIKFATSETDHRLLSHLAYLHARKSFHYAIKSMKMSEKRHKS